MPAESFVFIGAIISMFALFMVTLFSVHIWSNRTPRAAREVAAPKPVARHGSVISHNIS